MKIDELINKYIILKYEYLQEKISGLKIITEILQDLEQLKKEME